MWSLSIMDMTLFNYEIYADVNSIISIAFDLYRLLYFSFCNCCFLKANVASEPMLGIYI